MFSEDQKHGVETERHFWIVLPESTASLQNQLQLSEDR